MKASTALWFARPRAVEFRKEPLRRPEAGEVGITSILSAISHGTEMLVYRGLVDPAEKPDLPTIVGGFDFPVKYGYASVGRIEEVGWDVDHLKAGDLAFAYHPHQTEFVAPANLVIPLPKGIQPEIGIFQANLETAVNILLDTPLRFGEAVLVMGQGVVGLLITLLLCRHGASPIIAVDPIARRRDLAVSLGADQALPPGDDLVEAVSRVTKGRGVDVAIEASGQARGLQQAIDLAAFQGTVVVCSWYGLKPADLSLGGAFHRRRLRFISSQVSNIDPALSPRWDRQRRTELVMNLLGKLPLSGLITDRFPFLKAAEAYQLIDRGSPEVVQVVLDYADK